MRTSAHRFLIDGASLPADVSAAAAHASRHARVVYVEAEFFGGTGAQASLGWQDGRVALGPLRTQTPGEDFEGFEEVEARGDWAINRALVWLGVRGGKGTDAFEAVGLASIATGIRAIAVGSRRPSRREAKQSPAG